MSFMHNIIKPLTNKQKQTSHHMYSGEISFCTLLMVVYCKAECELLAMTHVMLEVFLGRQWEDAEQLNIRHICRTLQTQRFL